MKKAQHMCNRILEDVLNTRQKNPVEFHAHKSEHAKALVEVLASLRCVKVGGARLWRSTGFRANGVSEFYSVHVEGYGAPIHVHLDFFPGMQTVTLHDVIVAAAELGRGYQLKEEPF